MKQPLYKAIASALEAKQNCLISGNHEWSRRWMDVLKRLDRELPSGAGFDNGSVIVKAESVFDRIVIATSFHHMNEHGCYDGWTEHRVVVEPDMVHDFTIKVSGRDRNGIKDFIADAFREALAGEVEVFDAPTAADDCSTPETCGTCHECHKPHPCPEHPRPSPEG